MKIVITQNDRNHSNFYQEVAVLGFDFRLSCYTAEIGSSLRAVTGH